MNERTKQYNKEFAEIKPKIYERDHWGCLNPLCPGEWGGLTVDHIVRRSLGGKNQKENLILLCVRCHSQVEIINPYIKVAILRAILKVKYDYRYDDKYEQSGDN